jgi:RHS repeat-associated protein
MSRRTGFRFQISGVRGQVPGVRDSHPRSVRGGDPRGVILNSSAVILSAVKDLCILFVLALLAAAPAFGQVATGLPPYGSFGGGPFDTVNNANLNVHFAIPIVSKAGLGLPFYYKLTYDSSLWSPRSASGQAVWTPKTNWGWNGISTASTGYVRTSQGSTTCTDSWGHQMPVYYTYYGPYVDPLQTSVNMQVATTPGNSYCNPPVSPVTGGTAHAVDGSGYTLIVNNGSVTVVSRSGLAISPPLSSTDGPPPPSSGSIVDPNSNAVSASVASNTTTFTDTLGTTPLAITVVSSSETDYAYTGPNGSASFKVLYTAYTVQSNFGCSSPGVTEYGPTQQYLVSEIDLPDDTLSAHDRYTFTYETTPGHSPNVTGRLASVTLPTGGQITYSYSGGYNGITCADGSTATLTRKTKLDPNTTEGTWSYAHSGVGSAWTTTITDPQANRTVMNFQGVYETERKVYQGTSTLLATMDTCYNGASIPCTSTAITLPISNRTVQTTLANFSSPAKTYTTYETHGMPTEIDEYTYGPTLARKMTISYATLTNIYDRPLNVLTYTGGSLTAHAQLGYDSHGNMLTATYWTQSSSTLGRSFTYNTTGTVATATDVNNNVATYTYATGSPSCNGAFPTSVQLSNAITPTLSRSMSWNCDGGVMSQLTDENGQTTNYTFNDPYFWRLTSTTDPTGATTNISYSTNPYVIDSTLNFNGSTSTVNARITLDGLGRVHISQRRQGQGAIAYDSVETDYDSLGRPYRVSMPYSAGAGVAGGSTFTTTTYDALNRSTQVTDGGGGTVSYSYTKNDVLVTVGPAPGGENTKRRQLEYDALGRLTSVCEITSATGSGSCAQNTSATGYRTSYAYNALNNLTAVTQNAQGSPTQSRSYGYDMLGRLTSQSNPESGTATYAYDSDSTGHCTGPYNGDPVMRKDAVQNYTCYAYDALHRVTSITYPSGSYAGVTAAKHFVYDSATVNGQTMQFAKARLAEAYTGSPSSKITDLGFSYSPRGEVADVYESTPNSGGYYHVAGSYWENGLPKQLSGVGLPTLTYTPEGEGRLNTVSGGTQNPVSGTSYNVFGLPFAIIFGSGDSDIFGYDSNTGRMISYQFNVNSQSVLGQLTWNQNGMLRTLGITDPFDPSNQQTCNYTYDDLARVASANCGSIWSQTFAPGVFGNLSKSGTISFQPTYNQSTNRVTQLGGLTPTYDANGNLTYDTVHNYTWDADANSVTIDSIGLTFDALDRMVEQNRGGSYTQVVYGPGGGKLALMNGQTLAKGFVPLPGGATAVYNSSGLTYYRHADWLGSSRLASTPSRTVYYDGAYAPYGENYAETGNVDRNFTGQNQDTVSSGAYPLYDFLYREYHPVWGRWVSPDPVGLRAVDPTNPQSWNRYAYVTNNPLALTDPLGLVMYPPHEGPGGGGGGGGGGCDPFVDPWCEPPEPCDPFMDPFCEPPGGGGGGGGGGGAQSGGGSAPSGNSQNPGGPGAPTGIPGNAAFPYEIVCTVVDGQLSCTIRVTVTPGGGELPTIIAGGLVGAVIALLPKGYYWNPIDQAVNTHHPGEWTFRNDFQTLCSTHVTVVKATGEVKSHVDTINPVPGYPLLFAPPLAFSVWTANSIAHWVLDVKNVYPGVMACQ